MMQKRFSKISVPTMILKPVGLSRVAKSSWRNSFIFFLSCLVNIAMV